MSLQSVRAHLKKWNKDGEIIEFSTSSATVDLAAAALGVAPSLIAKTLSFRAGKKIESEIESSSGDKPELLHPAFLIVVAGDVRIDNKRFKLEFGIKSKMLRAEEVVEYTGHPVGGVCPFGLKELEQGSLPIFFDESLRQYPTVYPACGSPNSAIPLSLVEMEAICQPVRWVNVGL